MIRILLVEDDPDLGSLLKQYFEMHDLHVKRANDGIVAGELLRQENFDIAVLDIMMPNEDGFSLAHKLKKYYPHLPFLFVTARKMKEDIIHGLKLGADDYILKPFDADELILRIHNILRRKSVGHKPEPITLGLLQFDPDNLLLRSSATEKMLTEKESQLLHYLCQNQNRLLKREEILTLFWKEADFFSGRSLDVFISRLRKYLSSDPSLQIESIRGVGFRFTTPDYLQK